MAMQKVLRVKNNFSGKHQLKKHLNLGYRIVSSHEVNTGYSPVKTIGLGLVFLPLALMGKRKNETEYVLEKDD